ncbi:MAG: hypothetical protein M1840_001432 [Geoglossum simile]|nr:MAG: hypothetical protein M1840_001432 [Geoglossum simile]
MASSSSAFAPLPPPDDPPALLRPCCLRCSKAYKGDPALRCRRTAPDRSCDRCATLKLACRKIPPRVLPLLRQVQEAAEEVVSCEGEAILGILDAPRSLKRAKEILAELQQEYTTRVEAALRAESLFTIQEAVPLMLARMKMMIAQQNEMLGVLRYIANLPQHPRPNNSHVREEEDVEAWQRAVRVVDEKALEEALRREREGLDKEWE